MNLEIFDLLPFTRRLRGKSSAGMVVVPLVLIAAIVVVTAIEGTVGSIGDLRQVVLDIGRGGGSLAQAEPESGVRQDFPLLRDVASWVLAGTIIAAAFLLQMLWNRIASGLADLTRTGAIGPASTLRLNWVSRLLLIDRKVRGCAPSAALPTFVDRVNKTIRRFRWVTLTGILTAGSLLAWGLVTAQRHGLYVIIAPEHLSAAERTAWAEQAYHGWWAGDRHAIGWVLYIILAVFAMSLILTFNVVGVITVYVCVGLYFLANTGADWANRDGRWGWLAVARVYATVYLALAVQGIALSAVILLVKAYDLAEQREYTAVLVWLGVQYVVMIPVYLLLPRLVFQRVQKSAQRARIAELDKLIKNVDLARDVEKVGPIVAEVERCWSAKIKPMSLRPGQFSSFFAVILFPFVLTISQILLS